MQDSVSEPIKGAKSLAIRLSSLGDVILAASALEVGPVENRLDWVTAPEYQELFRGHPRINQLLIFDRKSGYAGWKKFCRQLWKNQYSEIYDLHRTLRTCVMRFYFFYWNLVERTPAPKWHVVSKQRVRLLGYYVFKALWPRVWRPTRWVTRFTQLRGGTGLERPNFRHLLINQVNQVTIPKWITEVLLAQADRKLLCVMPSSRWDGKKWPEENYFQLLQKLPQLPIVLGTKNDVESVALVQQLEKAGVPHISGVGKLDLIQTAHILDHSVGYLGGDTGLAHLAEALGKPAHVIFGPTVPDMGYGPFVSGSQALGRSLWCRPCSRDGRGCHRLFKRHTCLKQLSPSQVSQDLRWQGQRKVTENAGSPSTA